MVLETLSVSWAQEVEFRYGLLLSENWPGRTASLDPSPYCQEITEDYSTGLSGDGVLGADSLSFLRDPDS